MRRWLAGLVALALTGCQAATAPTPTVTASPMSVDPFADLKLAPSPMVAPPSLGAPVVGQVAPDFLLPAIEGPPQHLSDWRGKPTIIAFWAFWCTTWKEVNAGFDGVAAHSGNRCYLATVDIDCQWKDQLSRPKSVPYVALMDPRSEVSQQWNISAVPTLFVLDSKGVLRARYQGYPGNAKLLEWIDTLQKGDGL